MRTLAMREPDPSSATSNVVPLHPPPPRNDDDGALLVLHRSGDTGAFRELVERLGPVVYGLLTRSGVPNHIRDDLFQETWVRVHDAADRYDASRPLRPWILTIAANLVRSWYRRPRRELELEAQPISEPTAAHERLEASETAAYLEDRMQSLSVPQRQVVQLCCIEQLPQAEAARALDMPVSTVKTHLRRARMALAEDLRRRRQIVEREVNR